jgi:hypothetical protein
VAVTTLEIPPKKPTPATATSDVAQTGETSAQQVSEVAHTPVEALVETDARVGIQNYGRLRAAKARACGMRRAGNILIFWAALRS